MIKLKKGDIVDIVAPAGFSDASQLIPALNELKKWGLTVRCNIDFDAFHPFHSDDDDIRFQDLKTAINAKDSKVIWCLRGGYGSGRLLDQLNKLKKPSMKKMVIGYSDITVLHAFFNQKWGWETIHGPTISTFSNPKFEKECFKELKSLMFSKTKQTFELEPLNELAEHNKKIVSGSATGGNLAMIQTLIGTKYQLKLKDKILFIEDVNERGYRIDRILNHLKMVNAFNGCKAIVFGDFSNGIESTGESYVDFALMRFALEIDIPVYKTFEFGHGSVNRPIVFLGDYKIKDSVLSYQY